MFRYKTSADAPNIAPMSALDGWIDVARTGTWQDMTGRRVEIDDAYLDRIVAAYADADPAPVVVGHPTDDAPAYGRVSNLRRTGDRLQAKLTKLMPAFRDAVEADRYSGRSVALVGDRLRHLAFLGGRAPAIPGLAPTSFSDAGDGIVVQFADDDRWVFQSGWRAMASVARSWREHLIASESIERADEVIPDWQVEQLSRAAEAAADAAVADARGFASPAEPHDRVNPYNPTQEDDLSGNSGGGNAPDEAALAARAASLDEREASLAAREAADRAAGRRRAAEQLLDPHVTAGRILPAERPALAALLASLPEGDEAQLAFAAPEGEGEVREQPSAILDRLFAALPSRVNFRQVATGPAPSATGAGTAADDEAIASEARALMAEAADRGETLTATQAVDRVRAKRGLTPGGAS